MLAGGQGFLSIHHPPSSLLLFSGGAEETLPKPGPHQRAASLPCRKATTEEVAAARTRLGNLSQRMVMLRDETTSAPPSPLAPR